MRHRSLASEPFSFSESVLGVRGVEHVDAAWQRSLAVTTRFQYIVTAVLTMLALLVGYFIVPAVPTWAFLAMIGWVALSTLILGYLNRATRSRQWAERWYPRLGLFSSVLTVTLGTYLIGQAQGDFYLIYFLPLITAGVHFGLRGAWLTAFASGLSYFLLARATTVIDAPLAQTLAVRISFLFLVASAIGLLSEGQRFLLSGLRVLCDQVAYLAMMDPLTAVSNRRALISRLEQAVAEVPRYNSNVSLLLIDLDDFKRYNDTRGHVAGDQALVTVAGLLRQTSRDTDLVGRFGGDEFALVLPHTTVAQAYLLAQRLREGVAVAFAHSETPMSLTIGIAGCPEHASDVDDLFARADEALYAGKAAGRDTARVWSDEVGQPPAAAPKTIAG